tara:strand:- start:24 stop:305 length:282 start_codon:yes stop_codon:yes gene_type:complete
MSYAPSVIKSIQTGTITISAGNNTSGTATITAVVTAKSAVRHLGWSSDGNSGDAPPIDNNRIDLTNTTTVTVNRNAGTNSGAVVVGFVVTEFY